MEVFLQFVKAFLLGGALCAVGQIIIDKTRLTPARVLTGYVVAGVILGATGVYEPLARWGGAGATVPLTGFGYILARVSLMPRRICWAYLGRAVRRRGGHYGGRILRCAVAFSSGPDRKVDGPPDGRLAARAASLPGPFKRTTFFELGPAAGGRGDTLS